MDTALFELINIRWGWEPLAPIMRTLSDMDRFVPVVLALVAWMVIRDGLRGRFTVLALLFLIPASDQLSSHVVKPVVERPRPCRAVSGIAGVKNHGVRCSGRGSFPSSHATNIAAAMFLIGWRYRRAALLAALIAFGVGYSRIYLGVHYPLDVVGGWALGTALGSVAAWTAARAQVAWAARSGPGAPRVDPTT